MKRLIVSLVGLVLLSGCQGSNPAAVVDPFLGRQKIPPPRTGWFHNQADPYYPGVRQAAAATGQADDPGESYAPPGGSFRFEGRASRADSGWSTSQPREAAVAGGDSISIPESARRMTPVTSPDNQSSRGGSSALADGRAADEELAGSGVSHRSSARAVGSGDRLSADSLLSRPAVVRTIPPPPQQASAGPGDGRGVGGAGAAAPRRFRASGRMIDITELPEHGADVRSSGGGRLYADRGGAVRLASGADTAGSSPVRPAVATEPSTEGFSKTDRYDYDPQYRWLRGRLEYSQVDRRWKLRYIPIDGDTDRFGGSVVLVDSRLLSGYERGDFVEVHGQLESAQGGDGDFAPRYRISRIRRLAP